MALWSAAASDSTDPEDGLGCLASLACLMLHLPLGMCSPLDCASQLAKAMGTSSQVSLSSCPSFPHSLPHSHTLKIKLAFYSLIIDMVLSVDRSGLEPEGSVHETSCLLQT